jgi:acetyl-CoA carboxylase beta subunit
VTCGFASCGDAEAVSIVSFEFMGGSMGEATGRRIVDAIDQAV